jgi:hypothetical protein
MRDRTATGARVALATPAGGAAKAGRAPVLSTVTSRTVTGADCASVGGFRMARTPNKSKGHARQRWTAIEQAMGVRKPERFVAVALDNGTVIPSVARIYTIVVPREIGQRTHHLSSKE